MAKRFKVGDVVRVSLDCELLELRGRVGIITACGRGLPYPYTVCWASGTESVFMEEELEVLTPEEEAAYRLGGA